jgi:uncharacterized Zn finger protein (UPF0148 family)
MPVYECPKCGRRVAVPKEGTYYCKVCGPDVLMQRVFIEEELRKSEREARKEFMEDLRELVRWIRAKGERIVALGEIETEFNVINPVAIAVRESGDKTYYVRYEYKSPEVITSETILFRKRGINYEKALT